ncbi:MAG TPA: hypothetical protein DCW95_01500 [Chryseobacterium sp.]|nr:hypothetical protein [Chryseobacterium sp.]
MPACAFAQAFFGKSGIYLLHVRNEICLMATCQRKNIFAPQADMHFLSHLFVFKLMEYHWLKKVICIL